MPSILAKDWESELSIFFRLRLLRKTSTPTTITRQPWCSLWIMSLLRNRRAIEILVGQVRSDTVFISMLQTYNKRRRNKNNVDIRKKKIIITILIT